MNDSTRRFASLPPYDAGEILVRTWLVPPDRIGELCNLVEAYDGIGLVRTLDRRAGIVECWTLPDTDATFARLFELLNRDFPIHPLDAPASPEANVP